jgi:hypothetical protein
MSLGKQTLGENGMEYTMCVVEDKDVVDQLFFHDSDGNMIEICNCNKKPPQPENITQESCNLYCLPAQTDP